MCVCVCVSLCVCVCVCLLASDCVYVSVGMSMFVGEFSILCDIVKVEIG